jgi:hypothetical protein
MDPVLMDMRHPTLPGRLVAIAELCHDDVPALRFVRAWKAVEDDRTIGTITLTISLSRLDEWMRTQSPAIAPWRLDLTGTVPTWGVTGVIVAMRNFFLQLGIDIPKVSYENVSHGELN